MNTYEEGMKLQETAKEAAEELTDQAREQAELGKRKIAEFNEKAMGYIKDHPWTSLSLSLGVGALLGFLCRR
jgi:ElaB/YqjD/DUF883 family membrane-anchored ribosome-binding protein